ncbi:7-carboxy-7-deazaguanine synthase [Lachnospiraceae bacterium]|nr:7-carboxy-7-deazaguanine synthase [Lachnospiraceae bacterium]
MGIKKFIDIYVPTETCNLQCHYCYIALLNKFSQKIHPIGHTAKEIRKALSRKRLGGICMINICAGGETLLSEEILPIVKQLLEEGHYVMVVTNGTVSRRFDEVASWGLDLKKRLFFKFSLHYLELERLKLLEVFAHNVNKVWRAGCSITVEVTSNDRLIERIPELKRYCMENFGALCHITIARDDRKKKIDMLTKLSYEEYVKAWNGFGSDLLEMKLNLYGVKRREYCYAGAWSYYINLSTGNVRQCYCGMTFDNIYQDTDKKIKEVAIGRKCGIPYCYNGHAFIAFGSIPRLAQVTFAEERNRKTADGRQWLQPEMKRAMESRLADTNEEYGWEEKLLNIWKEIECVPICCKNYIRKIR